MLGSFGFGELILIFLVVLLIFGANRIPEIARGLGKGIREFKDATNEISRELNAEDQRRRIDKPQAPQGATQPQTSDASRPEPAPEPARADDPSRTSGSE
ncbi:Sec-independent protein translocase subunit TatA/TatB [Salisaeta longa]|uniref:Sec-independent protein translocase subunit TatA/TatB n=1 Tax=Salisaeta longa TaxID=503170 RepID=UPI0003B5AF8B|nr:twin-arginine translocase TatA/TatE family subunit [Salisaeta longa]